MAFDRQKIRDDQTFSIELGVSRRKLMKQLSAIGATASLAGCPEGDGGTPTATDVTDGDGGTPSDGGTTTTDTQSGGSGGQGFLDYSRIPMVPPPTYPDNLDNANPDPDVQRHAEFVIQNVANPFFTPLIAGFNDALNQFGWQGGVSGPSGGTQSQSKQIEIINTTIDQLQSGRDVLVSTVLDGQAYIAPFQRALDNDIAVINGHSTPAKEDWNNEKMRQNLSYRGQQIVVPHVGIRDRRGGVAMAAEAYERAENNLDASEYTVLIGNGLPGNPAVTRRVDPGARNYFATKDNVTVIEETLDVTTDFAQAQSRVESRVTTNPDINIILGAGFWTAVGASAAVDNGVINGDETVIGGFDLVDAVLSAIKDGAVDFTMGQDPYGQGFMNVPLAWMYMDRGIEMKHIEFGVTYADNDNVDYAIERNQWSALRTWQEEQGF